MNVLVTGAAGFLTPHVAAAFREAGHVCRLTDLLPGEGSTDIKVTDLTRMNDALRVTKDVDAVCHLGGVGGGWRRLHAR